MASIFTLENVEDFSEKLNMDELYEKKRNHDLSKLALFNKILNRIHVRIKLTSKQKLDEQFCWFVVPEVIIGVPKYDQGSCIAYLMDKLKNNGFNVRYIHPNTLFISWGHFVPSYVRSELKKKTGVVINEYGVRIDEVEKQSIITDNLLAKEQQPVLKLAAKRDYTPIKSYKPSGILVYDEELLNKIEDKFT
jgi:hypothetical protein